MCAARTRRSVAAAWLGARPAAGHRLRGDPGRAEQGHDDADPEQPGRRLRPDRPRGVAVMEKDNITGGSFEVTNVIGAGGSVAMTRLMNAEGDERTLMTAGLGVVGSLYSFGAPYKLEDATPLAQLIEDQEGVLVPADSPYETIDDLVAAWQDDPGSDRRRRGLLPRRPRPPLPDAARYGRRHRRRARSATCPTTAAAR